MITVGKVRNRKDWKEFLRFPWKIHGKDSPWVPPILRDQARELDPRTGFFFHDGFGSEAEYFLATRKGETVGRIAAIRNGRHLRRHDDGVGFFGFFESIDDPEVAEALLEAAETWLANRDLFVSRGPASFSIYDPVGVTVAGTDLRPGLGMAYTPAYYDALLSTAGYRKARDLFAYHLSVGDFDRRHLDFEKAAPDIDLGTIRVRSLDRDRLEAEADIFARIFSEAWDDNWGALPMIPEDFLHAAHELGPFLDENLGYVAMRGDEPIGIFLAVADPWEILQRANGKLGPATLWKIATRRRHIHHFRVMMAGVLPPYRYSPVLPLLLREFHRRWKDYPSMDTIEFSWILEDNHRIRDLLGALGARPLQTFRVYDKFI